MEKLKAGCSISDMEYQHRYIPKVEIDKRIAHQLARSLADDLVTKEIDKVMVKRKEFYNMGETIYDLEVYLLTRAEHNEYLELKRFKEQMQNFVK